MRQRDLPFTDGDWHGLPLRVRAPHLEHWHNAGGWQLRLCMGLASLSIVYPSPWAVLTAYDVADDRLRARMHVHDFDDLLSSALQLGKRLGLHGKRAEQLHSQIAGTVKLWNLIDPRRTQEHVQRHRMHHCHLHSKRSLHFVFWRRTFDHRQLCIQRHVFDFAVGSPRRADEPV